jgi:hypothetical protein
MNILKVFLFTATTFRNLVILLSCDSALLFELLSAVEVAFCPATGHLSTEVEITIEMLF